LRGTAYKVEDYPEPEVEVWDELFDGVALELFLKYSTQWRMGPAGPAGLDLAIFHAALDRKGITGDEFDAINADLGIIEQAALKNIHAK
jgi:hypothetical protein